MRSTRFLAGLLTVSLGMGLFAGGLFHVETAEAASEHARAHFDHVETSLDAFDQGANEEDCHLQNQQTALWQHSAQGSPLVLKIALPFAYTINIRHIRNTERGLMAGRSPPLFEQATQFASTLSMRV